MIVEVVAACLTVCFCSSLAFARWAMESNKREDPARVRLMNVRACREPLEILFKEIAGSAYTAYGEGVKDQRLRELAREIERLSQIEATILQGDE
jgi:hypothetical protein